MVVRRIECSSCNTVYKVDGSKIPDKVVRTKCKKCGSDILINEHIASENKKQTVVKKPPVGFTAEQQIKNESTGADKRENPVPLINGELLEKLAAARDKVQGFFKDDDDEIEGLGKVVYISLQVFGAWVLGKIVAFILGIFLPAVVSGMIGISVFVLLLNWRTLVELNDPSELVNVLLKEKWAQFTVPLVLANLYAIFSEIYDVQLLPLVFAVLLIVAFAVLPFYVNYKLAVSSGKSVPLTMLLTLFFSWVVTLFLSVMAEESS